MQNFRKCLCFQRDLYDNMLKICLKSTLFDTKILLKINGYSSKVLNSRTLQNEIFRFKNTFKI